MFGYVFLLVIAALAITLLILMTINKFLPRWFCDHFGWHIAPKEQNFDGCSFTGTCPRCGRKILQDGQGNWFSTEA